MTAFALSPVVPNPTMGGIEFEYALPRETSGRLSVVDLQGREMAVLADGALAAGRHRATWNSRTDRGPASAGLYFVRFQAAGKTLVQRFAIVR